MALMKCPDCGRDVSSRAAACPHCGCPASDYIPHPAAAPAMPMVQPTEPAVTVVQPVEPAVPVVQPVAQPVAPVAPAAPVQPAPTPVQPVEPVAPAVQPVAQPVQPAQPVAPVAPAVQPAAQPVQPVQPAPAPVQPAAIPEKKAETPADTVEIKFPDVMYEYADNPLKLELADKQVSLATVPWNQKLILKLTQPTQLTVKPERGKGPGLAIFLFVLSNIIASIGLLDLEALPICLLGAGVAIFGGVWQLCHMGRRPLVTFKVEPGKCYELKWRGDDQMECFELEMSE